MSRDYILKLSLTTSVIMRYKEAEHNIRTKTLVLQSQDLRVGQVKEPCIGLIQENLIENSV